MKRYSHIVQDIKSQHFDAQSHNKKVLLDKTKTASLSKRPTILESHPITIPSKGADPYRPLIRLWSQHSRKCHGGTRIRSKQNVQRRKSPQTVTSRSTFIRRVPRSTDSTTSVPTVRRSSIRTIVERDDDHPEKIKKPKSDSSYFAMIVASRTRKAAVSAKNKIKKGWHTLRDISMSLKGSSRRHQTTVFPSNKRIVLDLHHRLNQRATRAEKNHQNGPSQAQVGSRQGGMDLCPKAPSFCMERSSGS